MICYAAKLWLLLAQKPTTISAYKISRTMPTNQLLSPVRNDALETIAVANKTELSNPPIFKPRWIPTVQENKTMMGRIKKTSFEDVFNILPIA